ncbi:DNA-processing protein DprA [Amycolatopsis sp. GM8]|uniref:DNA-processing protein DprA n=1 Tax=Amycolatopsis sp. GM8 TaxID=2896530 RepID=UPI001F031483|nr:DNA-processing protein DprA [Amycolatopsis sp. GM8]
MTLINDVRLARAFLARAVEPPAWHTARFVDDVGPLEAARTVHNGHAPEEVVNERRAGDHWDLAKRDLSRAGNGDLRLLTPEDNDWPTNIGDTASVNVPAMPLALWVRGSARLAEVAGRSLAVVGARASTAYGENVAADVAYTLARRDIPVWSGAAYGIDGAVHRGTLSAGKAPTVAVLACGVDTAYPRGHTALLERTTGNGLLVSEYPPGTPPAGPRFLARNRLLAMFTSGVVVVEAGLRSGSLNTAGHAEQLGRPVFAVPGPITSPQSGGCHRLIQDHRALLVTSVEDILHHLTDAPWR